MIASNPTESLRRPYETVATPDQVPLYDLVPVHGPEGEPLGAYRGVRRKDTSQVVSIVSHRYQLVQHREVAEAMHAIGEALEQPNLDTTVPAFPREQIRLFAGGRRMEVRLVVGTRYELAPGESVYPGVRVMNSLDGSWAVRAEGTGVRIACANQLYAGMHSLVELREVHLSSETDLMAMLQKGHPHDPGALPGRAEHLPRTRWTRRSWRRTWSPRSSRRGCPECMRICAIDSSPTTAARLVIDVKGGPTENPQVPAPDFVDWLTAFDPNYPAYAMYHTGYAATLASAAVVVGESD